MASLSRTEGLFSEYSEQTSVFIELGLQQKVTLVIVCNDLFNIQTPASVAFQTHLLYQ